MAALEIKDVPEFLEKLEKNEARLFARTRRAIRFSLLTFQRPGEIRQAKWEEIDWNEKVWSIPAERTKMKRSHLVPLCSQVIEILKEQYEETGHLKTPWVFPSIHKPPNAMSDGTVNVALKKLGYSGQMTAHGFRALARTAIRENLKYDSEIIERQLAHKASGVLGEAYDRTKFIEDRIQMMQDWANYIDDLSSNSKIIRANFQKKSA